MDPYVTSQFKIMVERIDNYIDYLIEEFETEEEKEVAEIVRGVYQDELNWFLDFFGGGGGS